VSKANTSLQKAIKDFDNNFKAVIQAGVSSTYESAIELANIGADKARELVDHPGSYRPYYDKDGNLRMSSRPGEPPASGPDYPLYKSIYSKIRTRRNFNPAISSFGATAPYSEKMEFGTSRVSPRPFLRPAMQFVSTVSNQVTLQRFAGAMMKKAKKQRPKTVNVVIGEG
jgi:hypothetical protein